MNTFLNFFPEIPQNLDSSLIFELDSKENASVFLLLLKVFCCCSTDATVGEEAGRRTSM